MLRSLEKFAQGGNTDSANKATGLLDRFEKGNTLLMLQTALQVFTPLENLNRVLQAESATLSGMVEAAEVTLAELQRLRTVETFQQLFIKCTDSARQLDLEEVAPPRQRKPPARYAGSAAAYHAVTAEEHYQAIFFVILDNAMEQLRQRFDKSAHGISRYLGLEKVLLQGKIDYELVNQYPELDVDALDVQLKMFHSQFPYQTVKQARENLQTMCPEVRSLFRQIEQLVRLLLVCPASSCSAERSFSALRRLKTWLRNSMTQKRLNHVAVCHVHQDHLDNIDMVKLADALRSAQKFVVNCLDPSPCNIAFKAREYCATSVQCRLFMYKVYGVYE